MHRTGKISSRARYYQAVTGHLEEEAAVYRRYARTYPGDPTATVNLAASYSAPWDNSTIAWPQRLLPRNSSNLRFAWSLRNQTAKSSR